jgi:RHS repeat-associated protein
MIDDGTIVYVYDAWNRLIKVRSKESANVTLQTAKFDGLGRRIKKVVTSSGDFDKTEVYFYDGQQIVQINNGSGAMVQQFIHGTQYIDELVMVRVADKGDLYVHQDANWNVIGLTDLGRHVVERYVYTPYGELIVHQDTGYGDRDGDQDVDSTDKGTVGTTCTGTVSASCRILDLDFDGDYDSADATKFDALTQGAQRHPGRPATNVSQPFAHQGLLFEPELAQYQNRARQYHPSDRRFLQRDPVPARLPSTPTWFYADSVELYAYERRNPPGHTDESGKQIRPGKCPGLPPRPGVTGWTRCDWIGSSPWCVPCVDQQRPEPFYTCTLSHETAHCGICNYGMGPVSCCAMLPCGSQIPCNLQNQATGGKDCGECAGYCAGSACLQGNGVSPDTSYMACKSKCICEACGGPPNPDLTGDELQNNCARHCTGVPPP